MLIVKHDLFGKLQVIGSTDNLPPSYRIGQKHRVDGVQMVVGLLYTPDRSKRDRLQTVLAVYNQKYHRNELLESMNGLALKVDYQPPTQLTLF